MPSLPPVESAAGPTAGTWVWGLGVNDRGFAAEKRGCSGPAGPSFHDLDVAAATHTRLISSLRTPSPTMATHKPPLSNGILDSRGHQTPLALVIEWGSEPFRVLCPYCADKPDSGGTLRSKFGELPTRLTYTSPSTCKASNAGSPRGVEAPLASVEQFESHRLSD
jgi:hypothetical protein